MTAHLLGITEESLHLYFFQLDTQVSRAKDVLYIHTELTGMQKILWTEFNRESSKT